MTKFLNKIHTCIYILLITLCARAQDTIKSVNLDSVVIRGDFIELKEIVHSGDKLNTKQLQIINVQNIGDASKFLGGVLVKDYGGLGGIKTVSVRGLSSNHTSVLYDGINLFDNQSGQIDLSKYSLSSVSSLALANAQFSFFLPTATSLASASTINIETRKPNMESKKLMGDFSLTYGNFNLFNSSLFLANKISNKDIVTILTNLINTDGRYPYKILYGDNQKFVTKKLNRENNDMFSSNIEINWFRSFSTRQNIKTKVFYYYSNRGLPSNVKLYYQNSKQRLWNKNFFAQTDFTLLLNDKLTYKNNLKFDWNYTRYIDPHYWSSSQGQDDNYTQRFFYMNNVMNCRFKENLFLAVTNDLAFNSLDYTVFSTVPQRFSSLTAILLRFSYERWVFTTNAIHSLYHDWFNSLQKNSNYLSPFISIRYEKNFWTSTFFYKNIFRMPTFNELYYKRIGNTNLNPEITNQLSWANVWSFDISNFRIQPEIDLYYNNVRDKIVAIPINQFIWSMLNYGKVDIYGIDIKFNCLWSIKARVQTNIKINYSYQKAIDMDESSYTYRQNLPYMPENVISIIYSFDYKAWRLGYTCLAVDKRWSLQENISDNILKSYTDHSVSLSYDIQLRDYNIKDITFTASVNNIFNKQYEIIRSYPMMGTNCNMKIRLCF